MTLVNSGPSLSEQITEARERAHSQADGAIEKLTKMADWLELRETSDRPLPDGPATRLLQLQPDGHGPDEEREVHAAQRTDGRNDSAGVHRYRPRLDGRRHAAHHRRPHHRALCGRAVGKVQRMDGRPKSGSSTIISAIRC